MVAKVQIKRTSTNDLPPTGLLPGELCVEMGVPTRLWVGVPTSIDSTGKKLLAAPTTGSFVLKSGDTMTGNLLIAPASTNPILTLTKATSGLTSIVQGVKNGLGRWAIELGDAAPESTGNAGSDFAITRFADNGSAIGRPMIISRATGTTVFNGALISGVSSNVGTIYFGTDSQHYLTFNGTDYTLQGNTAQTLVSNVNIQTAGTVTAGAQIEAIGSIGSGAGFRTKAGLSGAQGTNLFNFDWNGNLIAWVDNVNVGQVAIVCDYRIKQNVATLASTWDKVKSLNPIKYNYKANEQFMTKNDDIEHWGFLAHELQSALVPDAASGVKDAENILQSPNPLVIIAALTKALQEAMLRIEALETAAAIR
jgi:endosialidase-like protein